MQTSMNSTAARSQSSALESNKVLRNTYALLSLTLLFSAMTAAGSLLLQLPHPGIIISLVGFIGLYFLTAKLRNSIWALPSVFALTGFMGYTLGPIVGHYLAMPGGTSIVMNAFAMTGIIFLSLSAYVLTTKKNFSFMGGFLMVGLILGVVGSLAAIFFQIPALSLAISAMFVVLMSGFILYETSNILHGGETNYIMATVSLYVSIYNLFTSLLHLLGFLGGED
ncbi:MULTISPECIES: Bax inhibitor-1/YccA family protein [unclassified Neptuniibacter]|uniref:Bax inhibitor-1/YccA family protein n=1 Tax=unclassified Neptuniibacter TaxID=2630693 RepID=UPI0025EC65BC|nr:MULTISPECIES: Bax inhibitor-1/YccA family protein [unclassified Neptuniibacter]